MITRPAMPSDDDLVKKYAPKADGLLKGKVNKLKSPDKKTIVEATIRARRNDDLVTVTRADIEQRLGDTGTLKSHLRERLKELVDYNILSVDTTDGNHVFTLAVPVESPEIKFTTWYTELSDFNPTEWGKITSDAPTHVRLHTDQLDISLERDLEDKSVPDWLFEQLPPTDNPYAPYARYAKLIMAGTVLTATLILVPLGYPRFGILFLALGFAAFSAWVPLQIANWITTRWTNPANIRPSDLSTPSLIENVSEWVASDAEQ